MRFAKSLNSLQGQTPSSRAVLGLGGGLTAVDALVRRSSRWRLACFSCHSHILLQIQCNLAR